jgi:cytochrome P450
MELTGDIGENVFNTRNIPVHRRQRKLLSGAMSESSITTLLPIIRDRVALTIQKMGQEMKEHGAADVFKWWMFMTTDIVAQLTFGDSFRMLEQGKVASDPH